MPDIGIGSGGLFGQNIKELGIPSEEEYIDSYCERRGVSRGLEDREFYSAYNFFRLAAILQGIAGSIRDGTAPNAKAKSLIKAIEPLAEIGWGYALKSGR